MCRDGKDIREQKENTKNMKKEIEFIGETKNEI
jgi:hypothetical protein